MSPLDAWMTALPWIALIALTGWLVSLAKRDAGVADSVWGLFFLAAAIAGAAAVETLAARGALVMTLVAIWALRLSGYLVWRNWGQPEDRRYRAIRARNEPRFSLKSLYLVFGFQAAVAWCVALPLAAAIAGDAPLGLLDALGALLWLTGFAFETAADWQLARFRSDPANKDRVLDTGLWRYSRHPNYFGECLLWWGYWLFACAAGGWWTLISPLVMTALLLEGSGVALLERDIGERRPAYRDYIARTSAFFPLSPRGSAQSER